MCLWNRSSLNLPPYAGPHSFNLFLFCFFSVPSIWEMWICRSDTRQVIMPTLILIYICIHSSSRRQPDSNYHVSLYSTPAQCSASLSKNRIICWSSLSDGRLSSYLGWDTLAVRAMSLMWWTDTRLGLAPWIFLDSWERQRRHYEYELNGCLWFFFLCCWCS